MADSDAATTRPLVIMACVRLGVVQYRPPKGRPDAARRGLVGWVERACQLGADLVVCPEMATSGYVWPDRDAVLPHAEPADGPTAAALGEVAARHATWVLCGIPELEDVGGVPILYNSALVVAPDGGLLACYRKVLLYDLDTTWARPGDRRMVVETPLGRLAPAVCMDINAEDFAAFLVAQDIDLLGFCTNWVEEDLDVHGYLRWRLRG